MNFHEALAEQSQRLTWANSEWEPAAGRDFLVSVASEAHINLELHEVMAILKCPLSG